ARSSPMEMNCDFSSTCGDDSGFSPLPWRCSAGDLARTRPIIADSYHWAPRTARSSPMEMNYDFSSTCGDDSEFPPPPMAMFRRRPCPDPPHHPEQLSLGLPHGQIFPRGDELRT